MRKAVNLLIIGCVLGALGASPVALSPVADASPSLAFVSGTVKDDGGAPLAGAVVALLESQIGGKEVKSTLTDAEGRFTTGVAPGRYRLRAAAEGFKPVFALISLTQADKMTHNFALKRRDTLVEKRGDRDDYRWIGRSVPRSVLHVQDPDQAAAEPADELAAAEDREREFQPSFRGVTQVVAVNSAGPQGANFFGTNFAVSGALTSRFELALVGQKSFSGQAPQRISAVASVRPADNHQVTASVGYGQVGLRHKLAHDLDLAPEMDAGMPAPVPVNQPAPAGQPGPGIPGGVPQAGSLNQISLSAVDSWQVFQPLLVIYGFDYSRFVGAAARQHESMLPRFAVQYTPSSRLRLSAAVTPGAGDGRLSPEGLSSENLEVPFESRRADVAYGPYGDEALLDRSRRFEFGVERLLGDGSSSVEATTFYDVVVGHGVGVLALPLEASPETQAAFAQMAHQVTALNGATRGARLVYSRRFNDHVTASAGYSFGVGQRFTEAPLESLSPARMFTRGYFQVASAKLDLDFTEQTGTRVSTVVRLSPSAVIFAIDPFAGRMSVYDPNINIYVTQDLPSFGLPVRWQAMVDIRNLLDQLNGVEDGTAQLIATRSRRSVRGGIAFRW